MDADEIVFHNAIGFDIPAIQKLYPWFKPKKVWDSLVWSRLLDPDIDGGHSIEAWGVRFGGQQKVEHEDWSKYTPEMRVRCDADVEIGYKLWEHIKKERVKWDWEAAYRLEEAMYQYCFEQEQNGVLFDKEAAVKDMAWIDEECGRIQGIIRPYLSLEVACSEGTDGYILNKVKYSKKKEAIAFLSEGQEEDEIEKVFSFVKKPFLQNGDYAEIVKKWYEDPTVVGAPFCRIEFVEPDMNSREKFKKQLLRLGWQPIHFTEKGSPQFTTKNDYNEVIPCPSLEETLGDLGKEIATYFILRHRQSQIKGWVYGSKGTNFKSPIREDGRIPAGVIPDATNTHRAAHRVVANVPRPTSIFGKQMRAYFTVPPGYKMVGCDFEQLEDRIIAAIMGDEKYIEQFEVGDSHWYFAQLIELIPMDWVLDKHKPEHKKERDKAKKGKYTMFFGAGDAKFGKDMGMTAKEGRKARQNLYKNLPKFERLINQLKEASKKGWLKGLDNRKIWMRKGEDGNVLEHKALNTWVQCAGALVAKAGLLFVKKRLLSNPKYDAKALIWYHDEGQWQVKEEHAEEFAKEVEKCFEMAGDYFKLKCPIKGSATVGMNWAETH